jgi:hypothetical protein
VLKVREKFVSIFRDKIRRARMRNGAWQVVEKVAPQ